MDMITSAYFSAGEIRILPMSREVHGDKSIERLQAEFFDVVLRYRRGFDGYVPGEYRFHEQGLKVKKRPALVLFQYDSRIVASALLLFVRRFREEREGFAGDPSGGAFFFDPDTIHIVDPPLEGEDMKRFGVKDMSNAKYRIQIDYLPGIIDAIAGI